MIHPAPDNDELNAKYQTFIKKANDLWDEFTTGKGRKKPIPEPIEVQKRKVADKKKAQALLKSQKEKREKEKQEKEKKEREDKIAREVSTVMNQAPCENLLTLPTQEQDPKRLPNAVTASQTKLA
jgi:hypothetical protein